MAKSQKSSSTLSSQGKKIESAASKSSSKNKNGASRSATKSADVSIKAPASSSKPAFKKQPSYDRITYVMQGGGALGSYQVGAYKALHEKGYEPNWIAGISIGAINAAIIAGNPPEKRYENLMAFWDKIATYAPLDFLVHSMEIDVLRSFHNRSAAWRALTVGQSGFYYPNPINPYTLENSRPDEISFYKTEPLKETLLELVDFDYLNTKKIWLSLGAVHVKTGRMVFFNNVNHKLGPEHIMASAALPPGFPAVEIDGELFWDGGIYLNTPITAIFDKGPVMNTLCFMMDCFNPMVNDLPDNLDRILEREKDIRYSNHTRRIVRAYSLRQKIRASVAYLGSKIPEELKTDPVVKDLLKMACPSLYQIVHLVYKSSISEHSQKDYNFAYPTMQHRMQRGYEDCSDILKDPKWEDVDPNKYSGALVYSNIQALADEINNYNELDRTDYSSD